MKCARHIARLAALAVLVALPLSNAGAAGSFYVDAARPDDAGDGESWATAKQTIQAAVDLAGNGDTVWVTNGVYVLTEEIVLSNTVTLVSVNGSTNTIVDGDGVTRCFRITSDADAVIDGFTITNGMVTADGGAGIRMESGTVRNCRFLGNKAQDPNSPTAGTGGGGGIWMSAGFVTDCWFEGNVGIAGNDDGGGGVRMTGGTVSNSWFVANFGRQQAGGVSLRHSSALVVDCTFIGNTANHSVNTPAAYAFPGRIYRSTITGHAHGNSQNGAVGVRDGGIVDSCIVTNNTMGGVYFRNGYVLNTLIADNGGQGIHGNFGARDYLNNTVVNNGGYGITLGASAAATVANSIFYGNAAGGYDGAGLGNASWFHNLGPEITDGAVIVGNITNAPQFISSTDYRLQPGSPGVDAGMDLTSLGITTDIVGTPRPTGAAFDIGCYELAAVPRVLNLPAVATGTEADLAGKLAFDGGLTTTVTLYWGTTDGGTNASSWANETVIGQRVSGDVYTTTVSVDSATRYYFRNVASNDAAVVWADHTATFVTLAGDAETRVWTGWGGDGLASNPANWLGDEAPQTGDGIVLSALSSSNLTWDAAAPHSVAAWSQAEYGGLVTFETVYGTGFTNFTVTGDVTLESGTWTHQDNTTAETYRLRVSVGGDLTLMPAAAIDVSERGYNRRLGEGYDVANSPVTNGAGHGGAPGRGNAALTYGSIVYPNRIGSGGREGKGGGAIDLTVAGTTALPDIDLVDSRIRANGETRNGGGGAGGSIVLTTGGLMGGGSLKADGGGGNRGHGSGGRIAIILTGPEATFESWTGSATTFGGPGGSSGDAGAGGTVYRQAYADGHGHGTAIVDNDDLEPDEDYADEVTTGLPPPQSHSDDLTGTHWLVRNGGWLEVTADTAIESLVLQDDTTRLELAGYTLTVEALIVDGVEFEWGEYPATTHALFTDRVGGGKVVIPPPPPGTLFLLR